MLNTDELPEYTCHKRVWAVKIIDIVPPNDMVKQIPASGLLTVLIAEFPYNRIEVSEAYLSKHKPHVGGYFIVYEDGYESFSPAKPFEAGYKKTKQISESEVGVHRY